MNISRLWRRIGQMGVRELAFRVTRYAKKRRDQFKLAKGCLHYGSDLRISASKYKTLWDSKNNFYFSSDDRQYLLGVFKNQFPEYLPQMLARAEGICEGKIPVFDTVLTCEGVFDWHMDPVSSSMWPQKHWSEIQVVGESYPMDAKWTWEVNRHQYLLPVAIAYWATGHEKYAAYVCNTLDSWIEDNQPGIGINWVESLELSFRIVTWIWLLELVRGADQLTASRLHRYINSLLQQAGHIYRYPSFFISPNTHLLGEGYALYMMGCLYPELHQVEKWKKLGKYIFNTEVENQIGSDGVHSELSTYYHCYAADYYAHYILLSDYLGEKPSQRLIKKTEKMFAFIEHVMRPDGSLPMLGDGDGGSLLPLFNNSYRDVLPLLRFGELLFESSILPKTYGDNGVHSVWLFGNQYEERKRQCISRGRPNNTAVFEEANIVTHRFGTFQHQNQLVFNVGKMGFLSAGHSHADYGHLELSIANYPFLVDSGTCSYKLEKLRSYCRHTSAHNTVVINNKSQVQPNGSFGWSKIPPPATLSSGSLETFFQATGRHACYPEVDHERSLIVAFRGMVICSDFFMASGKNEYLSMFHFDPEVEATPLSPGVIKLHHSSGAIMLLLHFSDAEKRGGQRNDTLQTGWSFPNYGCKKKKTVLGIQEDTTGKHASHFLFLPDVGETSFGSGKPQYESAHDYDLMHIPVNEETICYRFNHSTVKFCREGWYAASARKSIEVWEGNDLVKVLLVDATLLEWGGETVFKTDTVEPIIVVQKMHTILRVSTSTFEGQLQCRRVRELHVEHCRKKL